MPMSLGFLEETNGLKKSQRTRFHLSMKEELSRKILRPQPRRKRERYKSYLLKMMLKSKKKKEVLPQEVKSTEALQHLRRISNRLSIK